MALNLTDDLGILNKDQNKLGLEDDLGIFKVEDTKKPWQPPKVVQQFVKGVSEVPGFNILLKDFPVVQKTLSTVQEPKTIGQSIARGAPGMAGTAALVAAAPVGGIAGLGLGAGTYAGVKAATEGKSAKDIALDTVLQGGMQAATAGLAKGTSTFVAPLAIKAGGLISKTVAKVAENIAKRVTTGATFGGVSLLANKEDKAGAAAQTMLGAAFPMEPFNIKAFKNNLAMNAVADAAPTARQFKYNHDPRRPLVEGYVKGDNIQDMKTNTNSQLVNVGSKILPTIRNSKSSKLIIDISGDVVETINEKLSVLNENPATNKLEIDALNRLKVDLINKYGGEHGVKPINLSSMTPEQIWNYRKNKLDSLLSSKDWGLTPDKPASVRDVVKTIRGRISDKLTDAVPEAKDLFQRYGDLKSLQDRLNMIGSAEARRAGISWRSWATALLGAHHFGIAPAVGMAMAERTLENFPVRTKFAQWLYSAPESETMTLFNRFPWMHDVAAKIFGKQKTSVEEQPFNPEIVSSAEQSTQQISPVSELAKLLTYKEPKMISGEKQSLAIPMLRGKTGSPIQGENFTTKWTARQRYETLKNLSRKILSTPKETLAGEVNKLPQDQQFIVKNYLSELWKDFSGKEGLSPSVEQTYNISQRVSDKMNTINQLKTSIANFEGNGQVEKANQLKVKLDKLKSSWTPEEINQVENTSNLPIKGLGAAALTTGVMAAGSNAQAEESSKNINMNKIYQIESSNNPKAWNKGENARGLGQIRPIVLQEWNMRHKDEKYKMDDLFNPEINKKVANWYMNVRIPQMIKAYGKEDNLKNRIIAYNAGISYVRSGKQIPETTKNYIKKYGLN